jgi:nucleotide-binding universal stress UspA family protein
MVEMTDSTIVVGIDGSVCSEHALEWAINEALRSERRLFLIHAWHWSKDSIGSPMTLFGIPDSRKAGTHLLNRSATKAKSRGVHAATRLIEGSAGIVLPKIAAGAAMLVVGSHGRSGLSAALLGSVSRACLHRATCPVVVVSDGEGGARVGVREEGSELYAAAH